MKSVRRYMKTISENSIVRHINVMIEETTCSAGLALIRNRFTRALEDQRAVQVLRELKSRLIEKKETSENNTSNNINTETDEDASCSIPAYVDGESYSDWVTRTGRGCQQCWYQKQDLCGAQCYASRS